MEQVEALYIPHGDLVGMSGIYSARILGDIAHFAPETIEVTGYQHD